nr:hypothetical protein [Tanacetum cinerariifolium]
SKALSPAADEPASLLRDGIYVEAFPTVSSLDAGQDRENIAKTSAMPHESSPRVPSLDADEGSMQQRMHELMELCTILQRKQSQMAAKIKDQDLEIFGLKARVKSLKDKERRCAEPTQEDALITGGIIDIWEELGADKSTELGSNDTEEMQFDREDLHQLWILVKETFSIKQPTRDKEKELWVELKRQFEPDFEDQLWTYDQVFMHDPLDWKLYDTCGVHHVSTKKSRDIYAGREGLFVKERTCHYDDK